MVIPGVVLLLTLAQAAPAARDADLASIASGWKAVEAGQYEAAAKAADAVLTRRPWDHAAHVLKIGALARVSPERGLDAYERWLKIGRVEEASLLEPIAIAVLQTIVSGTKPELREPALTALARSRVPGAREALQSASSGADTQLGSDLDALRRGDAAAVDRLTKSSNRETRAAAVEALGGVKTDASRAALAALKDDPDPAVRMACVVALARVGDDAAIASVNEMLASGVPDVQIIAARAFEGRPGPWVSAIRPLLDNPDGLTRLEAAQALAAVDPEAARRVLSTALGDANPVIRYESARTLSETAGLALDTKDIAALRVRLRDADPAVRMAAASALLRLARE